MNNGEAERVAKTREQMSNELFEKVFVTREVYDADRTDPAKVKAYKRASKNFSGFVTDRKQPDSE